MTKTSHKDDLDPDILQFTREIAAAYDRFGSTSDITLDQRRAIAEQVRAPWRQGGPEMAHSTDLTVNDDFRARIHLPKSGGGAGGDPSPWTAYGVYLGIVAATHERLGVDSVDGLRVAVQGVGNVGLHLCKLLQDAGANVIVADVNRANLRRATGIDGVQKVSPREILYSDVDILAPCALGNVLNSETIPRIRAKVIAGAANNQLSTEADGERLTERGILYAPDYVINAGGIISVAREYLGQSSEDEVRREIDRIPERLVDIFREAASASKPTNRIADALARRLVAAGPPAA